jgi:hypothetical protein
MQRKTRKIYRKTINPSWKRGKGEFLIKSRVLSKTSRTFLKR